MRALRAWGGEAGWSATWAVDDHLVAWTRQTCGNQRHEGDWGKRQLDDWGLVEHPVAPGTHDETPLGRPVLKTRA